MVIDNNKMNSFLVLLLSITIQKDLLALYVISNILTYSAKRLVSFLNLETQRSSAYIIWFIMVPA